MQKKNLVVVRAGNASLHPEWLIGERDFDLVVSYYGDDPHQYRTEGVPRHDQKGSKWQGLYTLLTSDALDWRHYEYIWLPDDDLRTTAANLNGIFRVSLEQKVRLSQPASDWDSHISHLITAQHRGLLWRRTNFVEVMAPCFRRDFLEQVLPTFRENVSGWGLDFLWPHLLGGSEYFGALIIDSHPITHTRPVGSAGHGTGTQQGPTPQQEMEALLAKWGVHHRLCLTAMGCAEDGRVMDLVKSREALLGFMFMGLQAKWGQDPNLLLYLLMHARVSVG